MWGFPTFTQNPPAYFFLFISKVISAGFNVFDNGISSKLNKGFPISSSTSRSLTIFALRTRLFVFNLISLEFKFLPKRYATHLDPFPHALTSLPSELKIVIGKQFSFSFSIKKFDQSQY